MTAHGAVALAFWSFSLLIIYAYIGYPVTVWVLARVRGRTPVPRPGGNRPLRVSLLIAAHNEAEIIAARLRNALAVDYPRDLLEIVVASDGSSDGTAEVVAGFADRGVRLLDYPVRRGKASVLNDAMTEVTGDVVLFSDANTFVAPDAVLRVLRWFADPAVGVVCGRLVLTDPQTGRNVDSLYWKYETFLKKCESRLGALLGANGAIYAMRRELYRPIPPATIVDDFVIPLQAKLRTGCSIVYDPEAVADEETPAGIGSEFRRRARIGAGGFQSIARLWPLLSPRHGWVAFTFLSHKLLRWFCPFFMIGALATSAALAGSPLYRGLLLAQLGFYALSGVAAVVPPRFAALKPLRLTTMFTSMNAALLVGFARWVRGGQRGTWRRTDRSAETRAGQEVTA
jgi:cellulose synthase/poly-beta-1,6-N-acetylglucosamine synthase-like glycosyltransferase